MNFELIPVLFAGAIAAILMLATRIGMKKLGMDLKMDVLNMLGSMIGTGRKTGMILHVLLGAVFALPYVWGLVYFNITHNFWLWGLVGGFTHWIISGVLIGVMPGVSSFAKNFGKQDIMAFLMGHLLFGIIVGISYSYLLHL